MEEEWNDSAEEPKQLTSARHEDESEESFIVSARHEFSFSRNEDYEWSPQRNVEATNPQNEVPIPENIDLSFSHNEDYERDRIEFDVPEPLRIYQRHMGGIDKNDQIKECAGGTSKAIRKIHRWQKTVSLAIMDVGIVNSSIAWNMKAVTPEGVKQLLH